MEMYRVKIRISGGEGITEFEMIVNTQQLITIKRISELASLRKNKFCYYSPDFEYEVIAC